MYEAKIFDLKIVKIVGILCVHYVYMNGMEKQEIYLNEKHRNA